MANEYATAAELKAQYSIDDTIDDTVIGRVVESASRLIDGYCRRRFYKDTNATARRFRAADPVELTVNDFWDTATLVVETDDNADGTFETTWATTDFQVEPLNADAHSRPWRTIVAIDRYTWPLLSGPRACVRITAKWGWPAVPPTVKEACLLQAGRLFTRKDSPFGVAGSGDFPTGDVRMLAAKLDPDVQVMLDEFLASGRSAAGTTRIR